MSWRPGRRTLASVAGVLLVLTCAGLAAATYVGYFASDPVKLIEPASRTGRAKIVFLSGDLGLNMGMGPQIVDRLAWSGLPVVGFNSLTYFRTRRTPAEMASTVRALIDRADRAFGPGPVIMVGQSFGADALQVALADFTREERARIDLVVLVVPTDSVFLRASPDEMFNFSPPDLPAIESARTLDWAPVLCVHGVQEIHSLCPLLHAPNVTSVGLPGGHYLDHDPGPVVAAIERTIRREAIG